MAPSELRGSELHQVVARRLDVVRERIAGAGGSPEDVTIVAVTKGFGAEAVVAALEAGLADVGENYAQELHAKRAELSQGLGATQATHAGPGPGVGVGPERCRWHFLGHVQRNKVRGLVPVVHLWQGVDRMAAGAEIARRGGAGRPSVLVEINVSGEASKAGCAFDQAPALVAGLTDLGLEVRGLMAVGPAGAPERARPGFRRLRELAEELGLPERSMGMTDDLEVAVQEGSTMVRVGRALFGSRRASPDLRP